jgi:hypothetical protein
MKLNRDYQRLGILVHLLIPGVHLLIWMMRQVMVRGKRELITMQDKGLLLLSICTSMGIPFLGEQVGGVQSLLSHTLFEGKLALSIVLL